MISIEDENKVPNDPKELPSKVALWFQEKAVKYEAAAKEYAATMKRPKYLPLY